MSGGTGLDNMGFKEHKLTQCYIYEGIDYCAVHNYGRKMENNIT